MSEQPTLFDAWVYDQPDTLTKAEYLRERRLALRATWVRHHAVVADLPATWAGRPYQDVAVSGERL